MPLARRPMLIMLISIFSLGYGTLPAQATSPHATHGNDIDFNFWFSMLEIPFLILVIALSFAVAQSLKGGKFGSGMSLLAWGFLVMAIGHIHMQIEHLTGNNIFKNVLGKEIGTFAWFTALLLSWSLSGLGFYRLYKASRLS